MTAVAWRVCGGSGEVASEFDEIVEFDELDGLRH